MVLTAEFTAALTQKVIDLRKGIVIEDSRQLRGYNFKDNQIATETIVGAVLAAKNKAVDMPIRKEAMALSFSQADVHSGKYDALICHILGQLAVIDHDVNNSVDFH